jgi:enamine deaminase RidA (YjgF/YER057c/UK114 family)
LCELQVYATFPKEQSEVTVRTIDDMPGLSSGKVVTCQGSKHIYMTNLTGGRGPGDGLDFAAQAEDMFIRAQALLQQEDTSFPEVLRTWCYINDIERDYGTFNKVRNRFFQEHGVTRPPASTGIQGATYPRERGCAMDLYAVLSDQPIEVEVMHASTMNEAPNYGSAFSRGMKLVREDRAMLYVSGTASIDTAGNVVHVGDIRGQVHRMMENVEILLAGQGAALQDLATAITYLKQPEFLAPFFEVCAELAVPEDIPNTISVADVCRPEWLCEIEGIAVCPRDG